MVHFAADVPLLLSGTLPGSVFSAAAVLRGVLSGSYSELQRVRVVTRHCCVCERE